MVQVINETGAGSLPALTKSWLGYLGLMVRTPAAQHLQELLGLSDEELLRVLDADPLEVITGELEHKPELPILLDLLAAAEESAGAPVLRRWVRSSGPAGRPLDVLLARDFGEFEDALATLAERGFILKRK